MSTGGAGLGDPEHPGGCRNPGLRALRGPGPGTSQQADTQEWAQGPLLGMATPSAGREAACRGWGTRRGGPHTSARRRRQCPGPAFCAPVLGLTTKSGARSPRLPPGWELYLLSDKTTATPYLVGGRGGQTWRKGHFQQGLH